MPYSLVITDDADIDIENAMEWYEFQQKGLGKKYLISVKNCLKTITNSPNSFAMVYFQIRRVNTKKFPYSVFYRTNETSKEVIVFAITHNSRDEETWKQRIEK